MARQLLSIDGTNVEVMAYQWTIADQDLDSTRNLAGYLERNMLDHSVNKLNITFPPLNATEMAKMMKLLHKEKLAVKFLSPYSNSIETHTMYHSDLSAPLYWNVEDDDGEEQILYNSFSVDLIEY